MIVGLTRIRNESEIIGDTLDHLSSFCDCVIVYDDFSTDNTVDICEKHSIVRKIIKGNVWDKDRERAEFENRHELYLECKKFLTDSDWIVYIDADERIEFDWSKLDLMQEDSVAMRLYDFYITQEDVNLNYKERKFIGPEFRIIKMAFRFGNTTGWFNNDQRQCGEKNTGNVLIEGYVKHYGKAVSVGEWEKTCQYYSEYFPKYSEKWENRKGKAVHELSDFGNSLVKWSEKDDYGVFLEDAIRDFEKKTFKNIDVKIKKLGFFQKIRTSKTKQRILVGCNHLNQLGGSEIYTYTLITTLWRKGHEVFFTTLEQGEVSERCQKFAKFVAPDDLFKYSFDRAIISHNSIMRLDIRSNCVIQVCHGVIPNLEQPSLLADRFVSISDEVKNHLKSIGCESEVVPNMVDLRRFKPDKGRVKTIKKVLSTCQGEEANKNLSRACAELGLELTIRSKTTYDSWDLDELINENDLIVGIGRSVYESLACDKPVLIYDSRHYSSNFGDGFVEHSNIVELMKFNCSGRRNKINYDVNSLKKTIYQFTPLKKGEYRKLIKNQCDTSVLVQQLLSLNPINSKKSLREKIQVLSGKCVKISGTSAVYYYDSLNGLKKIASPFEMKVLMIRKYGDEKWRVENVDHDTLELLKRL